MATAQDKSRVLVVDDEPQITRVLRTVLTSQGYQVQTATEGEAALSTFAAFRPELVITDLYMPHMDGVELCKRIRAISAVPIIVLSVKGEERTKVEALDSGADDYVTKPFGIDELLARVRAALRRSGGDTEMSSLEAGEFLIDFEAGACTRAATRSGSRRRSSICSSTWRGTRTASSRIARCSKRSGEKRRRNSRSTCASSWGSCARSWSRIRPTRATSSPNPGWGIGLIRMAKG